MAIFHFSHDSISRAHSKQSMRSCSLKAAYVSGIKLKSQSGLQHDFSTKKVMHSEIIFPSFIKDNTLTIEQLWKQVDREETRKNSRTAEYFDVALPHELTIEQNIEIMRSYCNEISDKHSVCVQYGIHPADGDKRNIHAHFMFHTRDVVKIENGQIQFGKKLRQWSGGKHTVSETLESWRRMWAETVNAALKNAGVEEQIDHRSNIRRGIREKPGVHQGPQRTAWNRKIESQQQRRPKMSKKNEEKKKDEQAQKNHPSPYQVQVAWFAGNPQSGETPGYYYIFPDGTRMLAWSHGTEGQESLQKKLAQAQAGKVEVFITRGSGGLHINFKPLEHQKRRGGPSQGD